MIGASVVTILGEIQALSNERQQLWRIAHRDKFSRDWWKRHDRIEVIGKQLNRLWNMHRIELAKAEDQQSTALDPLASDYFEDFREHVGWYHVTDWRIEDETNDQRRYMSVMEGLIDNRYSNDMKKPTKKRNKRPKMPTHQRQQAIQRMIQLS